MLSNFGSWNCSGKRPAHPGCGRRHDHDEPIRSCDQVLADHLLPRGSRWHRRLRGGLWIARWGVVGGWMLDRRRELLTTDQAALLERGGQSVPGPGPASRPPRRPRSAVVPPAGPVWPGWTLGGADAGTGARRADRAGGWKHPGHRTKLAWRGCWWGAGKV